MKKENITIIGIGDFLVDHQLFDEKGAKKKSIQEISSLIGMADFAFANLEAGFCEIGYPREKVVTLKTSSMFAKEIPRLGINAVGLANNHALDFGFEGLFETMKTLDRVGVKHVGAGKNLGDSSKPLIVDVNNNKVGILAYSATLPLGSAAGEERPGINPVHVDTSYLLEPARLQEQPGLLPKVRTAPQREDMDRIEGEVESLRKRVDILFVSFHWGVAFQDQIHDYQRCLGHSLIDKGADVIFGHHAHRIQEFEVYKTKLIIYSPGDFMWHYKGIYADIMSPDSIIVRFVINKGRISEAELIPTVLDNEGDPRLASKKDKDRIFSLIRRISPSIDKHVAMREGKMFLLLT